MRNIGFNQMGPFEEGLICGFQDLKSPIYWDGDIVSPVASVVGLVVSVGIIHY